MRETVKALILSILVIAGTVGCMSGSSSTVTEAVPVRVLVDEDDGNFMLSLVANVPMGSSEYELYVKETETGFYVFHETIYEAPKYQDRETLTVRYYFPVEVFDNEDHRAYLDAIATADIDALEKLADKYDPRFVAVAKSVQEE